MAVWDVLTIACWVTERLLSCGGHRRDVAIRLSLLRRMALSLAKRPAICADMSTPSSGVCLASAMIHCSIDGGGRRLELVNPLKPVSPQAGHGAAEAIPVHRYCAHFTTQVRYRFGVCVGLMLSLVSYPSRRDFERMCRRR